MPSADAIVLPSNVKPSRYRLLLHPDLETFTFRGEQTVDIEIVEPTARIALNAAEMEITDVVLRRNGGATPAHSVSLEADSETATLDFGRVLAPGPAQLEMKFTGILNDRLVGFYRSEYQDGEGQTRYLATTQFEATDARRAFPCWDEPAQKAVFDVTLVFDDSLQAVSNTPIIEEDAPGSGTALSALWRDAGYVDLPAGLCGGRPDVGGSRRGERHEDRGLDDQRKGEPSRVRAGYVGKAAGILQRLFRHTLPAAQAGPHRHPRLCGWGDGELGVHYLPGDGPAGGPGELFRRNQAARRRSGGPRDGAYVVRRPSDHGMVGRPVAQRELRFMDGHQIG